MCRRGHWAAQHPGEDGNEEGHWATRGTETSWLANSPHSELGPRCSCTKEVWPGILPRRHALPVPAEHCEVVVNTVTLPHVHPLPAPFQNPARNTRQAKRKRTKVPGLRHRPPPACPAPAQPETQDKGLGQSEKDEGQRVDIAWSEGAMRERHGISLGT